MDYAIQNATDLTAMQMFTPRALGAAPTGAAIDKASKDFESMFVTQMLQPMFEGIKVDDMFGGGHGEEVMRSFLLQEYGKKIAASGALGISVAVKNAMIEAQNVSHNRGRRATHQ